MKFELSQFKIECQLALFISLIFFSCNFNPKPVESTESLILSAVDFVDKTPIETYQTALTLSGEAQDSLYQHLTSLLIKESSGENLLLEHLDYYEKLRGKNEYASVFIHINRGGAFLVLGKYDSCISVSQKGLALAEELERTNDIQEAHTHIGMAHRMKGDFGKATESYLKAMDTAQKSGDTTQFNSIRLEQAVVLNQYQESDKAIEQVKATLPWFEKVGDTLELSYAYTILGLAYFSKNEFESSIKSNEKSLELRRAKGNARGISESLNNLSLALMGQKNWEGAAICLKEALPMMEKAEDFRNVAIIRGNLGVCLKNLGQLEEAIACFKKSAEEEYQRGQLPDASLNFKRLAEVYSERGDYKTSIEYFKKERELLDTVFQQGKTKYMLEMNARFETAQKDREISALQAQKQVSRLWCTFGFLGFMGLLTLTAFLYLLMRQRKKLFENETQLQQAKLRAIQDESEKKQLELDFQHAELEKAGNALAEKVKMVETLKENLDKLKRDLSDRLTDDQASNLLEAMYQMPILTTENWVEFRATFEKVFPHYIANLKATFDNLTEAELRLAMLIRMKIRQTEIASMLGISPESVRKTHYRLRKKLGIENMDDLEGFLLQI